MKNIKEVEDLKCKNCIYKNNDKDICEIRRNMKGEYDCVYFESNKKDNN